MLFVFSHLFLCLSNQAKSLIVLDHHKSAEENLRGLGDNVIFDMDRCGATITWSWFHPEKPLPQLMRFIQEKDLYTWALPDSREFAAGFELVPFDFHRFREYLDDAKVAEAIEHGRVIELYKTAKVRQLAADAEPRTLKANGDKVLFLNTQSLISEVGNEIAQRAEREGSASYSLSYFYDTERRLNICSLRALKTNSVDVSAVARLFGGGGHAKASGFTYKGDMEDLFV